MYPRSQKTAQFGITKIINAL